MNWCRQPLLLHESALHQPCAMAPKPPTRRKLTFWERWEMLKRGLINPQLNEALSHLGHTDSVVFADAVVSYVRHEELKASLIDAKLIIRTGDTTPFANVIFRCGVPF